MDTVYIFASIGRFCSVDEMRAYIDETYTEDVDGIPSAFMRDVELSGYDPASIEAVTSQSGPVPLQELLSKASYADQWLNAIDQSKVGDSAICVFAPNKLAPPGNCTLEFVGAFPHGVVLFMVSRLS